MSQRGFNSKPYQAIKNLQPSRVGPVNLVPRKPIKCTRWAPYDRCKWTYGARISRVITRSYLFIRPFIGIIITPFIVIVGGPPCRIMFWISTTCISYSHMVVWDIRIVCLVGAELHPCWGGDPNYIWVVVSNIFYFHPYLGKWSNWTNIFQMGLKPPTWYPFLISCRILDLLFVSGDFLLSTMGCFITITVLLGKICLQSFFSKQSKSCKSKVSS